MKKILFVYLILMPLFSLAQNREKFDTVNPIYQDLLPLVDGLITYTEVVQVDGVGKNELFLRANEWVVKTFNSAKDVIQLTDKESGKLICKTITGATVGKGWNKVVLYPIFYLITIETRDNRYKITASNFIHEYSITLGSVKSEGENPLETYFLLKEPTQKELANNTAVAEIISNNIMSIFESAKTSIIVKNNDDW